jgi:hypothetical protein
LNNKWVIKEIRDEIRKKFQELNEKENTTCHICDAEKAPLKGKFRAMRIYIKSPREISNKEPNSTPQDLQKIRS